MSRLPRHFAVLVVFTLVLTACEESLYTSPDAPVVVDETGADGSGDGATATPSAAGPESGCVFDAVPGDAELGALLCHYQALLVQALGSGVIVDSDLMAGVTDAVTNAVLDPQGARETVEGAIAEIERLIAQTVPEPATITVGDLTDDAFVCMARAGELLQEAFQRESLGGVPIPEMDSWQATFDDAAALAETGDIVGATRLVCDLNLQMEGVLFQD